VGIAARTATGSPNTPAPPASGDEQHVERAPHEDGASEQRDDRPHVALALERREARDDLTPCGRLVAGRLRCDAFRIHGEAPHEDRAEDRRPRERHEYDTRLAGAEEDPRDDSSEHDPEPFCHAGGDVGSSEVFGPKGHAGKECGVGRSRERQAGGGPSGCETDQRQRRVTEQRDAGHTERDGLDEVLQREHAVSTEPVACVRGDRGDDRGGHQLDQGDRRDRGGSASTIREDEDGDPLRVLRHREPEERECHPPQRSVACDRGEGPKAAGHRRRMAGRAGQCPPARRDDAGEGSPARWLEGMR
jgi:hypothetical protein